MAAYLFFFFYSFKLWLVFVTAAALSSLCTGSITFHDNLTLTETSWFGGWKAVYKNQFLVLHFTNHMTL